LHVQKGNFLEINNQLKDTTIDKVSLFNILGQSVATWKIENPTQQNLQIAIKTIASGVYVAKIKTSKGVLNKKIIIK
jgi:LEA14-like dessication related protein